MFDKNPDTKGLQIGFVSRTFKLRPQALGRRFLPSLPGGQPGISKGRGRSEVSEHRQGDHLIISSKIDVKK